MTELAPQPPNSTPALGVRGNARRALGRLVDAEEDLEEAQRLLDAPGVTDPATPAEIHSYLGSLRKDQGRFEESAHHLHRAATLYGLLRDSEKAARVLLKLGTLHLRRHEPAAAIATDRQALELLGQSGAAGSAATPTSISPTTSSRPVRSNRRKRSSRGTRS